MNNSIFRKKSIARVSSPEQLNDYLRVANPSVWMILSAVIILLAGICVWGIFGHLDTVLPTVGICEGGVLRCYVADTDIAEVAAGMPLAVNGQEYTISAVSEQPISLDETTGSYLAHKGNLQPGQWVCIVTAVAADLPDGIYDADIITERVAPISFVAN